MDNAPPQNNAPPLKERWMRCSPWQALEMTSVCLDVKALVEWVRRQALTPDQLKTSHPQSVCDDSAYQVVTIGREPGIFISSDYASTNISGIPKGFRKKKDSRVEALAFDRAQFEGGKVGKWIDVPILPGAANSTLAAPAAPAIATSAVNDSSPDVPVVVTIKSDSDSDAADSHPIGYVVGDKSLVRFKTVGVDQ
ncbi:hypothetical protein C8R43DRAFT_1130464 [Mycena crocata]|nr:hypothetical protein C8R43DRAFT_1130464 [Mycena crocata]